jgi:hypothetical protein
VEAAILKISLSEFSDSAVGSKNFKGNAIPHQYDPH